MGLIEVGYEDLEEGENRTQYWDNETLKRVYNELAHLNSLGFSTWVTKASQLCESVGINATDCDIGNFKAMCKRHVINKFVAQWNSDLQLCMETSLLLFY